MRHFENKGGRFLGSQKNSQTVSFGENARVPSHAHHAQSHETLWTSRQKGRSGDSQTVSFSQFVSLVSDRLAFAEYGESPPPTLVTLKASTAGCPARKAPRDTLRIRKADFLGAKRILKLSHSANMRESRPMPTTPGAMRHFVQAAKKREGKDSQTVSFSQIVSLVSDRLTLADNGESPIPTLVTLKASTAGRPTRKAP